MTGRVFLLADAADAAVGRLDTALRAVLPGEAVWFLDSAALAGAAWRWALSPDGQVDAVVRIRGVDVRPVAGDIVVNRCLGLAPPAFAGAAVKDRDYAALEAGAMLQAWLDGLEARVLNHPPEGLSLLAGQGPLPWIARARRAGLRARGAVAACPGRLAGARPGWQAMAIAVDSWTSAAPGEGGMFLPGSLPQLVLEPVGPPFRRLLVCAGAVLDVSGAAVAAGLADACRRLAADTMLALDFATSADGAQCLVGADPMADWSAAEAALLAAVLAGLLAP